MRRQSKNYRQRAKEAKPVRDALIAEVGHCEICRPEPVKTGDIVWRLDVHEIANGPYRQKALDQRYAVLVVCWLCNSVELTNKALWPEAKQLAALRKSRPEDHNLAAYNELIGRGPDRITEEDVDGACVEEPRAGGRDAGCLDLPAEPRGDRPPV